MAVTLHIPVVAERPKQFAYFHELLKTALKQNGHTPRFITTSLPHARIRQYMNSGDLSIFWMLESEERNKHHVLIDVGLTNNLIGKRILLIHPSSQHLFDTVQTLADFRNLNLVCGFGRNWFDAKVWKQNNLRYKEHSGNWKAIYHMIPLKREYDYFSRGLNEVLVDAAQYPKLAIEKKLVLVYDRDFKYYLSKTGKNAGAKYRQIIENSMKTARENGLVDQFVSKHWGSHLTTLNYDNRIRIHLDTPE